MTEPSIVRAIDPALPVYYVAMPLNAEGNGPEMNPAKVVRTQHLVWDQLYECVAECHDEFMARIVVDAINGAGTQSQDAAGLPRLENCGAYIAQDNQGNWFYLNHANTWQGYQGPSAGTPARMVMSALDDPERFERGMGNISAILNGPRASYEIAAVVGQVRQLLHQTRWIAIEDEVPTVGGTYLLGGWRETPVGPSFYWDRGSYRKVTTGDGHEWNWHHAENTGMPITHWREAPKRPTAPVEAAA